MIERMRGTSPEGRSIASSYKDLVYIVANANDEHADLTEQTRQALHNLDSYLAVQGSDKTKIISAQLFIANIDDKPIMDKVWNAWIGDDPAHWPQRACLGVALGGHWLIEITVVAIR